MRLPITGGCQCGAVRYAIAAAPLTVYACHCTDCQRQSGSAFALSLIAPRDAVRITEGTPAVWERPGSHTASGTPDQVTVALTAYRQVGLDEIVIYGVRDSTQMANVLTVVRP